MKRRIDLTHELGRFTFANVLSFIVYGDRPDSPAEVQVVLDDSVQSRYPILVVEGLAGEEEPQPAWRENWAAPGDPWVRIIYGNVLGIIRQAGVPEPARRPD